MNLYSNQKFFKIMKLEKYSLPFLFIRLHPTIVYEKFIYLPHHHL